MNATCGGEGRASGPPGAEAPLNLIHTNNSPNPIAMRVPGRLTMPEAAWNQGYQDGIVRREKCPFPPMSRDAWAWSSGYIEGRANAKT